MGTIYVSISLDYFANVQQPTEEIVNKNKNDKLNINILYIYDIHQDIYKYLQYKARTIL